VENEKGYRLQAMATFMISILDQKKGGVVLDKRLDPLPPDLAKSSEHHCSFL